ncbi:MAG: RNA polymerase factor sigma-54 [Hyphomicrobiaceae bacterium]
MAISAKLEIRQGQQLVMTPQLQQAIRLLQFSNMELSAFVEAELERNPLLERDERDDEPTSSSTEADIGRGSETETSDAAQDAERTEALDNGDEQWLDLRSDGAVARDALDTEADALYPDAAPSDLVDPIGQGLSLNAMQATNSQSFQDRETSLEAYVSSEVSLKDHLATQINVMTGDLGERMIALYLLEYVDEAGYLRLDLAEAAERLGTSFETVERVLKLVQTCDPPGVFARDLAECLALQLAELDRLDPLMAAFLTHLDRLANHDLAGLKRVLGVDSDDIADMVAEIKGLNPKPGLIFGSTPVQPIVPDVIVRAAKDGSWLIELNQETLPRVLVNRSYYARVSQKARGPGDKDYLVECLQTANWLVKSLDQRARTILKVSEEIVRQQDGFFSRGVEHLRPLNLRTVADAISMHESTISRVTSNKYIATPRGIFELKYFFTSAINSADDGEAFSSEAVRHRIKALIDCETAEDVLSDDKIVEKLRCEGIDIARRTVAKYREGMHIASSIQRRRQKRLAEQMARA